MLKILILGCSIGMANRVLHLRRNFGDRRPDFLDLCLRQCAGVGKVRADRFGHWNGTAKVERRSKRLNYKKKSRGIGNQEVISRHFIFCFFSFLWYFFGNEKGWNSEFSFWLFLDNLSHWNNLEIGEIRFKHDPYLNFLKMLVDIRWLRWALLRFLNCCFF